MHNNIVIHLDALFDTRTAVWQTLTTQEQFIKMLERGYGNRECDRFDDFVPYDTYRAAYEKRDNSTLHNSTVSMIIPIIRMSLKDAIDVHIQTPMAKIPKIYIQVPGNYQLTSDEKLDMAQVLIHHFEVDVPISFIERSLLTMADLTRLEVGAYYIFDAINWLQDIAASCTIDERMICPGTLVCSAKIHTSAAPFNSENLTKAGSIIAEELKFICKLMFINALYYTSPVIAKLHLPD
jgi:hypothetical protein